MIRELGMAARHQAGNLLRLASGVPVAPVPMGSMTLDIDDVRMARESLLDPGAADDSWPARFESRFARTVGTGDAVSFRAGRVALSAILDALQIGSGDEVIVPGYTCVVVPNAIQFSGAEPVYCDIELDTYGAAVDSVRERIGKRTRAIVVQHLYGLVSRDYEAVVSLARERGIAVIEDCAHATGARLGDTSVGMGGDAGFFSREQSKIINTTAGGIAVSRRPEIVERLRAYQDASPWPDDADVRSALESIVWNFFRFKHRQRWWRGDVARLRYGRRPYVSTSSGEMGGAQPDGYRARMSPAIARLGDNQLHKMESYNERRRARAERWHAFCDKHGLSRPLVIPASTPVFLRYPVLVEPQYKQKPSRMYRRYGVWPGVWFVSHLHPSSRAAQGCPNADEAVARCVNLPCLDDRD